MISGNPVETCYHSRRGARAGARQHADANNRRFLRDTVRRSDRGSRDMGSVTVTILGISIIVH